MAVVIADAANAGHRPTGHHATKHFGVPGRSPRWHHGGVATLAIGRHHFGALTDFGHFTFVDAAHVHQAADVGVYFLHRGIPGVPDFKQPIGPPLLEFAPAALLRAKRRIQTARFLEVRLASIAITGDVPRPAVGENGIDAIPGDNFGEHLRHELEIARPQSATQPAIFHDHVARFLAGGIDSHPLGMRFRGIVANAMRIDPRDDGQVQLATAIDQIFENIFIAKPLAAVMKRHVGRIERAHAAGGNARAIGMGSLEKIEPPIGIERGRVFFDQGQLNPTHGPLKFFWRRFSSRHCWHERNGRRKRHASGSNKKLTSR